MKTTTITLTAVAVSLALAGCGGGSSSSSSSASTPSGPSQAYTNEHLQQIDDVVPRLAGYQGKGVGVALIDTGIYKPHTAFAKVPTITGYDALANDGDRSYTGTAFTDEAGHGTVVGSLIVGQHVGVAPQANLNVYKVGTATPTSPQGVGAPINPANQQEALKQALKDGTSRVVNISESIALDTNDPANSVRDTVIQGITQDDWIVVIAAGNNGGNTEGGAGLADDPAFKGHIIVVGSVDAQNQLASDSNTATSVEDQSQKLGTTAGIIEHFMVARGVAVCGADAWNGQGESPNCVTGFGGGFDRAHAYRKRSGTSVAVPQVSGAAAVIASAYPSLSGAQIVSILLTSAKDLGNKGLDGTYGAGELDVQAALQLAAKDAKATTV
jgi:subtilisin family serine protease